MILEHGEQNNCVKDEWLGQRRGVNLTSSGKHIKQGVEKISKEKPKKKKKPNMAELEVVEVNAWMRPLYAEAKQCFIFK